MKKKSTKTRSKTNFQNPKVQAVIRIMELSENRISRETFLEIGTKDIFYQMKSENYIKETDAGYYKATKTTPVLYRQGSTGDVSVVGGELIIPGDGYAPEKLLPDLPARQSGSKAPAAAK